jgi:hypothetical protein
MRRRSVLFAVFCLAAIFSLMAIADDEPNPLTKITVVVKTKGGRPVDRAEVIIRWNANAKHPRAGFSRAVRTTFEVRSNQDGEVSVPSVPKGNILIQVNAKGYQTFGKVFEVNEDARTIEVALNPPQQQYSSH